MILHTADQHVSTRTLTARQVAAVYLDSARHDAHRWPGLYSSRPGLLLHAAADDCAKMASTWLVDTGNLDADPNPFETEQAIKHARAAAILRARAKRINTSHVASTDDITDRPPCEP